MSLPFWTTISPKRPVQADEIVLIHILRDGEVAGDTQVVVRCQEFL